MLEAFEIIMITLVVSVLVLLCCAGTVYGFSSFGKPKRAVHPPPRYSPPPYPATVQPIQNTPPPTRSRRSSPILRSTTRRPAVVAPAVAEPTQHRVDELVDDVRRMESVFDDEFEILQNTPVQRLHRIADRHPLSNRSPEAVPYDDNRVLVDAPGDDYINASFIDGYLTTSRFIATQWPQTRDEQRLERTTHIFWAMLFQQKVTCLISLGAAPEPRHVFWPQTTNEEVQSGEFRIRSFDERIKGGYTLRQLRVQSGRRQQTITHFHLHRWPERDSYDDILEIAEQLKDYNSPIVVHCWNGCGPTASFIAICKLIDQSRHRQVVDVFRTVKELRNQRPSMVQSLSQYKDIYHALAEASRNDLI